jgi:ATP dependent DNA ligase domain
MACVCATVAAGTWPTACLHDLPPGLVLDGELVAFNEDGAPHWPLVVERVLRGNTAVPITFLAFDLLAVDGDDVMQNPWEQRRALLEALWVECPVARLADVFDDGKVLFDAVVKHGVEGMVAKRQRDLPAGMPRVDEDQESDVLEARERDRAHAAKPRAASDGRVTEPRPVPHLRELHRATPNSGFPSKMWSVRA